MLKMKQIKAKLLLSDGIELEGYSFGYEQSCAAEVVFNTAMTGYPESLTDPSYRGQILVLTYPLIGNYGVPPFQRENNMLKYYESDNVQISGLIVSDYSEKVSHWNAYTSLSKWLIENKIPALTGVDTRFLTKHLRNNGVKSGKIEFENQFINLIDVMNENLVASVSTKEIITYGDGTNKIVLVDCGVKNNIIRKLLEYDTQVIRVPWDYDFNTLQYDGLMISNGPGDPKKCNATINNLSKAFENDIPIFGICLGNQLMALASGGDTYKLPYGHRSHNQPVRMLGTNRCFITSQNHGYATDVSSLNSSWEPFFTNLNDNTNEGIKHKIKPFFSTQFHPEASSGPTDTDFLFKDFIEKVKAFKQSK